MKSEQLRAATAQLMRLLADTELKSTQDQRLFVVLRELKEAQMGKAIPIRRVERIVSLVVEIICENELNREHRQQDKE